MRILKTLKKISQIFQKVLNKICPIIFEKINTIVNFIETFSEIWKNIVNFLFCFNLIIFYKTRVLLKKCYGNFKEGTETNLKIT